MRNIISKEISHPTRRKMLSGGTAAAALLVSGCSSSSRGETSKRVSSTMKKLRERFKRKKDEEISKPEVEVAEVKEVEVKPKNSTFASLYGPLPNEKFPVAALPDGALEPRYFRQRVNYKTKEKPGSLVVDTKNFYLYLVEPNGKAMRYGVGLGKAGFEWAGRARVLWKQEWPKWTPPAEMIERRPELEKWSEENGGMPGGLDNPLGARALYIFEGNVDTLYRVHGTPEHWSIGKAVSSGCVRMVHQDVIDLYSRVRTKSPILVK
jgi:lipoprotein-anchoring transpeptidase ErfK/SrfK